MLSTEDVRRHLTRLTYKPGWTFEVYDGRWEGLHLVIRCPQEDAFHPGQQVILDCHTFLPPMADTEALEWTLMWRLQRMEVHEMREWFKRDGKVVSSPHADGADRDLV